MKTWQKKYFRTHNDEDLLRRMVKGGYAKTEDEAYSILKYEWKHATREFLPDGCQRISFPPRP